MNQRVSTAFVSGFLKAAADAGLSEKQAYDLFNEGNVATGLIGAGGGALAGGLGGYLTGDEGDPTTGKKGTKGRNAMLGAGLGGLLGGVGLGGANANHELATVQPAVSEYIASLRKDLSNPLLFDHPSVPAIEAGMKNVDTFTGSKFPLGNYLTNETIRNFLR